MHSLDFRCDDRGWLPRVAVALGAAAFSTALGACAAPAHEGSMPARSAARNHKDASLPVALRADAARRAEVQPDDVRLIEHRSVSWGDGSLGCPEPGRQYTQAVVPGFRIRVEAGGRTLAYHADRRGNWLWCPPGRAVEPVEPAN